jgi:hypothetical protein
VGVHKLQARTIDAEDSLIPQADVGCGKVNGEDLGVNDGDGMGNCSQSIIGLGHCVSLIHPDVLWGKS